MTRRIARAAARLGLCAIGAVVAVSCRTSPIRWADDDWVGDYDTAEARVEETSRPLLIVYKNNRRGESDPTEELLRSDSFDEPTSGYVKCVLLRSYEPDRRYVAQFGVQRAPALIVVHNDGTYHARAGRLSAEELRDFLARARPPGDVPNLNPYIPRQPRYAWHESIEEAEAVATDSQRAMLIVFYRPLTRDWARLEEMLERRAVHTRVADMVHCRIGVIELWDRRHERRFGPMQLPAMVIVRPDGSHELLELPESYETVARFADSARDAEGAASTAARATEQR